MAENSDDPVELYRAQNLPEAYMICNRLSEAGIATEIVNDLLQGVVGEIPGGWVTAPRIMVAAVHREAARSIIEAALQSCSDPEERADDRCLACGAEMGIAATCLSCGWSYAEANEVEVPEPVTPTSAPTIAPDSPVENPFAAAMGSQASWGEVAAVLAVGVVPNLLGAISMRVEPKAPQIYWLDALNLSGMSACTIFVTLYLIHRSGEPWSRFGLDRPTVWDFPLGLVMMFVANFVGLIEARFGLLESTHGDNWFAPPRSSAEHFLMVVKFSFSAFAEELVTRAYLITRLETLLRSRGWALVVSSAAFASYHLYQGWSGVVYTLMFGLAFGVAFLWGRRLWPLALGHAFWNMFLDLRS